MHETTQDLQALQRLLDQSYAAAGEHLLSIHTPERRLTAEQLAQRLSGMCLLTLATTTRDGRPITGPVDGLFFRGAFWFGSAPSSLRFRHIRARPHVSATHLPGEQLGVTVHGTAHEIDLADPAHEGFRDLCVEIYGEGWNDWGVGTPEAGATYARIDAARIFTFHLDPDEEDPEDNP
jgi:hypothetical protein